MSELQVEPQDDDYNTLQGVRAKNLTSNDDSTTNSTQDEDEPNPFNLDEQDMQVRESMSGGGQNVFSRD